MSAVELISDVWGTPAPEPDRASREFPISSFDPLASPPATQDYYDYQRTLDSIAVRLRIVKRDLQSAIALRHSQIPS